MHAAKKYEGLVIHTKEHSIIYNSNRPTETCDDWSELQQIYYFMKYNTHGREIVIYFVNIGRYWYIS